MTVPATQGIGIADFKAAMRALPAQVAVISAQAGDLRIAMTATAVTSLSAEPAQLLICVHKMARPAAVIRDAGAFAVNLVSSAQMAVANQCALPALTPEQRFEQGTWTRSDSLGQPLLDGALVNFDCRLVSQAEHGTHYVFVGLIEAVRFAQGKPLLYHDASYREVGPRLDALHLEWDSATRGF
ncbi:NADH-dependent flavin reductase [Aquimixticola soesokkakensis]|uniref:NADH-dependent flavin reductase n=1 Tax=Aquimixticola soesokkakensis TaxID=1519096 RepID=A0A1Y5RYV3_9RHOB|nr:flavin reductase family protein [Aquimixticola soesokkakensis]SLN28130.1 NADH-dependent flavin reductase [Aquimixticola soesokkakensis]